MKKLLVVFLFIAPFIARADEGMWMISLVQMYNYEQMKALGCKIPADKIYSESQPSLKDAIVSFGDYCTAEFVSKDGLLFTNHHCGYESIASLSSVGANYLDKGYWAKTRNEEIPVPGLFVKVLVRMQDVTDSILPKVNDLVGNERSQKITELIQMMSRNANPDKKYKVDIKPFFAGNQYFMVVYQVYNDVRFVGAPPSSIGKFGGDTDNWMWPRHTGDFSVFRVYANGSNEPVDFNKDANTPFHPKYALNVSLAPLKENDFAMVIGFPGSTDRYQTKYGINYVQSTQNPLFINMFTAATNAMKTEMDKDEAVKIKLAPSYANLMNSLKLYQGQLDGFERMHPVDIKNEEETSFINYVNTLPPNEREQYAAVLKDIDDAYKQMNGIAPVFFYPYFITVLPPSAKVSVTLAGLQNELKRKMPADSVKMMMDAAKQDMHEDLEAINPMVEEHMLQSLLKQYNHAVAVDKQAPLLKKITGGKTDDAADKKIDVYVHNMVAKSFVTNPSKLESFMSKPNAAALSKDPMIKFYQDMNDFAMQYRAQYVAASMSRQTASRKYQKAVLAMNKNKKVLYPDANFTMRLTYGTVKHYDPRDAVHYDWQTTTEGIMQKYIPNDQEFDVPQELRTAIAEKNYGSYGVNGTMPVCFLTNNDITGGNSGSPVLNANGDLIGLAFDGNYEGTAEQYVFEEPMNRTICVDVRYVLFIIDKVYGATNLVKELNIVGSGASLSK